MVILVPDLERNVLLEIPVWASHLFLSLSYIRSGLSLTLDFGVGIDLLHICWTDAGAAVVQQPCSYQRMHCIAATSTRLRLGGLHSRRTAACTTSHQGILPRLVGTCRQARSIACNVGTRESKRAVPG